MEFRAIHRYAGISPSKVKGVVELIRGRHVNDALQILRATNKRASYVLDKALRSALANADESLEANMENLRVKEARADEGPRHSKVRFRARGRASVERRRTSHVKIILDDGQ